MKCFQEVLGEVFFDVLLTMYSKPINKLELEHGEK